MLPEGTDEQQLSREQRRRSMRTITIEGMLYSIMTGVGDAYIPAAAVAMGASEFLIGLLSALPQLFGAMLQSVSLTAIRAVKSRKFLSMSAAFLQAGSWLAVIAVMLWPGEMPVELMVFFFSAGSALTIMANPGWSSWVSDIVPENERPRFFANRNRLMQLTLFITTFGAGLLLRQLQLQFATAVAFAGVFAVAFLARLITIFMHARTDDVKYEVQLIREIRLKHLFLLPAHRNEMWFLMFMALMNFTVQFAAPFFTPYMLSGLGFDVGLLGVMTALSILAKIASFPYWGKAIDRFGNRTVLVATAFLAPLVPFMWLFSKDVWMIGLFQVFSGFVWSGFDLSSFNYALALVGRDLRLSFIAKYNQFNGFFYAAGCVAGGLFLTNFGSVSMFGFSGILLVFLISGALRLAAALVFAPKLVSTKDIENTTSQRAMVFNLVAVYPTQGAVHNVVNGWDFTRKIVKGGTLRGRLLLKSGLGATGELIREGGRKLVAKATKKSKL
ncbi:Major Facilitator Superfamily protein [uncultured archaeon]|nr:Major Facilitator Superfamily protein [uncultured archaeon]